MSDKLNLLIIMCDQLNSSLLSCYGGPVPTPNIDSLAQKGVLFNEATCPYPLCTPSRASFITGLYPHSHGLVHNCFLADYKIDWFSPKEEEGITSEDVTTEKLLNASGYDTHHYGKWHLLGNKPDYYPDMFLEHHEYSDIMARDFEKVRNLPRNEWLDWYGWALPVEASQTITEASYGTNDGWSGKIFAEFIRKAGRLKLPIEKTFDYMTSRKTMDDIKNSVETPFMLTCSFNAPHDPNVVPSPYYEMFRLEDIVLPKNFNFLEQRFQREWSREIVSSLGETACRELMRIYYAQVKFIDDLVGDILKTLKEAGKMDNTLIIFTADHGDMAGGHGVYWKSTSAFYDEVTKIPLIIRHPKTEKPSVCDSAVGLTDIMPTILEFAGISVPSWAQGKSLVPFITRSRKAEENDFRYSFCERLPPNPRHQRCNINVQAGHFMVRGCGFKYVRYADGDEYLYNLKDDSGEMVNLVRDSAFIEILKIMKEELNNWLKRTKSV